MKLTETKNMTAMNFNVFTLMVEWTKASQP